MVGKVPDYPNTTSSNARVLDKSWKTCVGFSADSSSMLKEPVATAMVFAPMALPQATSCGVSPMM